MRRPASKRIYRLIHVECLESYLRRDRLHAPNHAPAAGLAYRPIHREDIQSARQSRSIPCGPGGAFLDYVPFYFCYRSVMLYQLHTGGVPGYTQGQVPLIHLVSTVERVAASGARFVFSDGQGIAAMTQWYDDLKDLNQIDWNVIRSRYWKDTPDHQDRQRRKQAEFLVHHSLPWDWIIGIGVVTDETLERVEALFDLVEPAHRPPVQVMPDWYY